MFCATECCNLTLNLRNLKFGQLTETDYHLPFSLRPLVRKNEFEKRISLDICFSAVMCKILFYLKQSALPNMKVLVFWTANINNWSFMNFRNFNDGFKYDSALNSPKFKLLSCSGKNCTEKIIFSPSLLFSHVKRFSSNINESFQWKRQRSLKISKIRANSSMESKVPLPNENFILEQLVAKMYPANMLKNRITHSRVLWIII